MPAPDGRGAGKGHPNRHPKHGPRCVWLTKVPEIIGRIEDSRQQYFDRRDIEALFQLGTTAAWKVMRRIGSADNLAEVMGVGSRTQDRLVARKDLLRFLLKLSRSPEFFTEQARREKIERTLADSVFTLKARQIAIQPPPPADTIEGLPTSIHLRPGRLEIEYFGTEDLLKQLWALAQAITHDYVRFQQICETDRDTSLR
jgi:hypothetical protein